MFLTRKQPSFSLDILWWNPCQYRHVVLCSFIRLPKAEGEDCTLGGSKEKDVDECVTARHCTSLLSSYRLWPPFCLSFKMTDVWLIDSFKVLHVRTIYTVAYLASSFTIISCDTWWFLLPSGCIQKQSRKQKPNRHFTW